MKISCFDYDSCLDNLRMLIVSGKSGLEPDRRILKDRSHENRANRVKTLKEYIRWAMSIMPKEPTNTTDLIVLREKRGVRNEFFIGLDEELGVNPVEFFKKIWQMLQSVANADALACFSNRQDNAYDELLAKQNENGSVFEFLEALLDAEKERRADHGNTKSISLIKVLLKREISQPLQRIENREISQPLPISENSVNTQHKKIKEGIKNIENYHEEFIVKGDLEWGAESTASTTRRIAVDNHIYKPLIAFHLMKKSCEIFPDEKMIQLEYWDDKYIEPVFDFFIKTKI